MSAPCSAASPAAWASSSARPRTWTACSCAPTAVAERYVGSINKYGVDIGFTKEAQMVWLVFAPGAIGRARWRVTTAARRRAPRSASGVGANVLVGGSQQADHPAAGQRRGQRRPERRRRRGRGDAEARPAAKWTDGGRRSHPVQRPRRLTPAGAETARRDRRAGSGGGAGLQRRQPRRDDGHALRPRGLRPRLLAHRAHRREAVGNLRHRGRAGRARHRGPPRDRRPAHGRRCRSGGAPWPAAPAAACAASTASRRRCGRCRRRARPRRCRARRSRGRWRRCRPSSASTATTARPMPPAGRRSTARWWRCARMSAGTTRSTSWPARSPARHAAASRRLRRGHQPLLLRDGAEGGSDRRRGDRGRVGADVARDRDRRAGGPRPGRLRARRPAHRLRPRRTDRGVSAPRVRRHRLEERRQDDAHRAAGRRVRAPRLAVATVKHAHHDADIDQPGTDSFRHRAAGATEVALVRRAALRHHARAGGADAWPRCWRGSRRPTWC